MHCSTSSRPYKADPNHPSGKCRYHILSQHNQLPERKQWPRLSRYSHCSWRRVSEVRGTATDKSIMVGGSCRGGVQVKRGRRRGRPDRGAGGSHSKWCRFNGAWRNRVVYFSDLDENCHHIVLRSCAHLAHLVIVYRILLYFTSIGTQLMTNPAYTNDPRKELEYPYV